MSHLKGGRVDVSQIQADERKNFMNLIEKHNGIKALVWDLALQGPLGLIAKYTTLKEYGVEKMYPIKNPPLSNCNAKHIIFICRPKLDLMDNIAYTIKEDERTKGNNERNYHLIFLPRKSLLCINKLEHSGIKGSLKTIDEFNCHFFPFDSDLLSMEISDTFREYNLENDPTGLYQVARSILYLQSKFGPIGRVWGKGAAAKQVHELLLRLEKENKQNNDDRSGSIDQIILIDRSVDLITPLATQLTYEGLIDEIFGLKNNTVNIPAEKLLGGEERQTESLQEELKPLILDSSDHLFADLRDKNFNGVGPFLSKQAKLISAQLEDRHEKSVPEIKLFVQRLPNILANKKSLAQHTAIAECIKEVTDTYEFLDMLQVEQEFLNCMQTDKANPFIEDMIAQRKPLLKILRLICLQCITSSGLKPKLLEYYKRELVQVYGLEVLPSIINFEKVGLLKPQSGSRQYTVLRKGLRLTVEDTSEVNPTDISYVHCIYAPLSVRLVEHLTKNGGWKQLQDYLGLLPGPTLEYINGNPLNNTNSSPKVVLVFFIGGCTFSEVSALRFISKQEESNVEFVIATTRLINGSSFLKSIMNYH